MQLPRLLTTILALPLLSSADYAAIILPKNGTHVLPGQRFAFNYNSVNDYCLSSFAYNIHIITTPPKNFHLHQTWATGSFMGRVVDYDPPEADSPKPAPDHLMMPNFAHSFGGFGVGESRGPTPVYLVVLEEYQGCDPSFGARISLQYVTLFYNSTSHD